MNIKKNILRLGILPLLGGLTWSCSSSLPSGDEFPLQTEGAQFNVPSLKWIDEGQQMSSVTRGAFYDGAISKINFDWEVYNAETGEGDVTGIFPIAQNATQQKFVCKSKIADPGEYSSSAYFREEDVDFSWNTELTYRSYYPFNASAINIEAVPLDFTDQCQMGKPDMDAYYSSNLETYNASEKNASKHLSKKFFMLSDVIQPRVNEPLVFTMGFIGGVVRFFLVIPEDAATVNEIRLVASKAVFYERASLNVQDGTTEPIGDATNNLVLNLNNVELTNTSYGHYLIAYMMAYSARLTETLSDGKLYIYIKGKNGSDEDVFYRTNGVSKKDITDGFLTQFSVKPTAKDDPIDVQPITLQEWQEGLTLTNGEEGTGTGNW